MIFNEPQRHKPTGALLTGSLPFLDHLGAIKTSPFQETPKIMSGKRSD